jgi:hypothetical protein
MKMGRRLSRGRGIGSRIDQDMLRSSRPAAAGSRLAAAGPAAHFDRNESHVIYGTGH